MVPVQGPPGFNSHPVNGEIHLPYKRRHADSHGVSCTENNTWLLTHDPTGGSTITDNMTLPTTDVDLFVLCFSVRFAIGSVPCKRLKVWESVWNQLHDYIEILTHRSQIWRSWGRYNHAQLWWWRWAALLWVQPVVQPSHPTGSQTNTLLPACQSSSDRHEDNQTGQNADSHPIEKKRKKPYYKDYNICFFSIRDLRFAK